MFTYFYLYLLIFLKSRWFFLNCSSFTYIILTFFLVLQNYRYTAFVNFWLSPLKLQKLVKNNDKIDE